ncbi:FAD linked oxidase N-terminal [Penicillium expansum]|nr:FAD linked oxidase N-terminal [Penicillium expansum]
MAASSFDELRQSLPCIEIYVPGDSGYKETLKRWSASCIKPAAIVVRPTTAEEVSVALRYATEHDVLPLAICGGGHSTSGDSASDGGMVIDLFKMRSTEDVNGALWEHGLGTVSGVVGDTGVGGLILDGGYGYLTGRRGLALDCLLGCEAVLANGDIIIANKDENADLFWAFRGAGPNFGIVTNFTSQAYPQGDCWAGFLAYPPDKLAELIEFGNLFMRTTDGNSMLSIIVGNFIPPDRAAGLLAVVFYNGTKDEGKEFFKPIYDLKLIGDTTATMPYTEDRHLFGGLNFTLPLNVTYGLQIAEHFWRTTRLPENEDMKGSTLTFEYYPTY